MNGKCEEGSIPIRRTKKEDVLRASSVKRYGKKKHRSIPKPRSADPDLINQSGHQVVVDAELIKIQSLSLLCCVVMDWISFCKVFYCSFNQHAIAYVEGEKYYGAKATINVWEPKIQQPNEFSLSQIWVLGGSFGEDLNSIEAGWQVHLSRKLARITCQYNMSRLNNGCMFGVSGQPWSLWWQQH